MQAHSKEKRERRGTGSGPTCHTISGFNWVGSGHGSLNRKCFGYAARLHGKWTPGPRGGGMGKETNRAVLRLSKLVQSAQVRSGYN
jgi:hypothetical protein